MSLSLMAFFNIAILIGSALGFVATNMMERG